jgi:integrase
MAKINKLVGKKKTTWQIDYIDPNGKRIRQMFKMRKEAAAELGKRVALMAEKRYLDVKKDYKTAIGELLGKYQENYGNQASYKTFKKYAVVSIKDYFGEDNALSSVRYVHLETYRNHLKQKLTKNGTIRTDASVNREMSCLHHIFSKAVDWEMMEKNPFDKKKSLQMKENNKRLRYLEEEEIPRLLDECSKHLRPIVVCALNTGMDRGEILNLKWDQIRSGFLYLGKYKTRPDRQIPINDDLDLLLREVRKEKHFKSEYVFTDAQNRKLDSIKRGFTAAVRRAGITNFRFKDLRHTFASHFVMRGGTMKELQELLGHTTMTMTMRYAHLSKEHKKKAINRLNGLTAKPKAMEKEGKLEAQMQ